MSTASNTPQSVIAELKSSFLVSLRYFNHLSGGATGKHRSKQLSPLPPAGRRCLFLSSEERELGRALL